MYHAKKKLEVEIEEILAPKLYLDGGKENIKFEIYDKRGLIFN